jgi:hypothetical protein
MRNVGTEPSTAPGIDFVAKSVHGYGNGAWAQWFDQHETNGVIATCSFSIQNGAASIHATYLLLHYVEGQIFSVDFDQLEMSTAIP